MSLPSYEVRRSCPVPFPRGEKRGRLDPHRDGPTEQQRCHTVPTRYSCTPANNRTAFRRRLRITSKWLRMSRPRILISVAERVGESGKLAPHVDLTAFILKQYHHSLHNDRFTNPADAL